MRVLALILALLAFPAAAEPVCKPRPVLVGVLAAKYGESPRFAALTGSRKTLVEVWANDATGSWTITQTNPAGVTCIVSTGGDFETIAPSPPGMDS